MKVTLKDISKHIVLISLFSIYLYISTNNILYFLFVFFSLIIGSILILVEGLSFYLMLLFIFFGTIGSVNIGFTLKISQILALFTLANSLINKKIPFKNIKEFFPLTIFICGVLPSFLSEKIFSDIYETTSNLRFLFNLIFLYIISFSIFNYIDNKDKLKKSIIFIFFSYFIVLIIGILQQIGFYSGIYNPNDYLGKHSLFVDFYGPFLRISPGTFANEFGEITQVILISISNLLIFMRNKLTKYTKIFLKFMLITSVIALIINFTRISWILYLLYLPVIYLIYKPSFKTSLKIFSISIICITLILIIQVKTNILALIPIIDRFSELSDLSQSSAGTRLDYWKESYKIFREAPLIGKGFGSTLDTHNVPLELLSSSGIIGFICFYGLMLYLLYYFYKSYKNANDNFLKTISLTIILSFLSCLIFDFTNHGIFHFILWVIIGLGLSINKININSDKI